MIVSLLVITIALFILCMLGLITENGDLVSGTLVCLVLVGIIGWGIIAGCVTSFKKNESAVVTEVLKGKHVVVVSTVCSETKDNVVTYTGTSVDVITDKTKFYWIVSYNFYNLESSRELRFSLK